LNPGDSIIIYADLNAAASYGSHSASGGLSWQDDKGNTQVRAIVLPAIQITTPERRVLVSVGRALDLLKDLALPLVLVVFGSYLQNQAKKGEQEKADRDKRLADEKADRDKQLADEKADRDKQLAQEKADRDKQLADEKGNRDKQLADEKAERDRESAQIQETWRLMLPKVGDYAEQHYMPIESSINTFRDALTMDDPAEGHLHALYSLLLFLRRMQHLADETGGLFFRDQEGEALAGVLWFQFRKRAWDALNRKDYARAMKVLSAKENYADFLDKLEGRAPQPDKSDATPSPQREKLDATKALLQNLSQKLTDWRENVERFSEDLALLNLFDYILSYEMNRPFVIWYERPARLQVGDFDRELKHLGPTLESLKQRLQAYLSRFKKENEEREKVESA
jgi:hypothetical protein